MKTQRVQERRQALHHDEDGQGQEGPGAEDDGEEDRLDVIALLGLQEFLQHHRPEDLGQLGVGERQGPESQVRGSVRDRREHVLDRVDRLLYHRLGETLGLVVVATGRRSTAAARARRRVVRLQLDVLRGRAVRLRADEVDWC